MIFICGHHDTGKSTLAEFLVRNGFLHIETGDIVRRVYGETGTTRPFRQWAEQEGHNFNDHIMNSVIKARQLAIEEGSAGVVVTGNRQLEGVRYILERIEPVGVNQHLIVYTEADLNVLYRRHMARPDRCVPGTTVEIYERDILGYDKEMGVEEIRSVADLVVCNNCEIPSLFRCFSDKLNRYGYQLVSPKEGRDYCPARRK